MCVHTTWWFVNVSPAMAENVMLFLCHHFKNLCFIMLVVLVITVPCNLVARSLLPWADSNHRPHSPQGLVLHRLFRWDVPLLSNALPTELHDNVKEHDLLRRCSKSLCLTKNSLSPLCVYGLGTVTITPDGGRIRVLHILERLNRPLMLCDL